MPVELIDTHAHLDESAFDTDRDDVVARFTDAGVSAVLTIGTTAANSLAAVELAEQYAAVHAVVGIQPNYAAEAKPGDWESIVELSTRPGVVAIGETGLDRYWDHAPFDLQIEYFQKHMELARIRELPFVVHCREADAEVVTELRKAAEAGPLCGVMHSFCGDAATAKECLELGLYISISGMVTYKKNDSLRAVVADVPLDRLLVETDAPYLSPVPKRGKRNEPANVVHTAECIALARGIPLEELAAATTRNARALFGI